MNDFTILDHLFFIVIAILLPVLSLVRGRVEMEDIQIADKWKFYLANGSVLWGGAIIVCVLWALGGRSWKDLGFSWPILSPIVVGLTVLFIIAYVVEMYNEVSKSDVSEELLKSAPFFPANYKELGQFGFLALSAGVGEEFVYRGFLVNYIYGHFTDPIWAYNIAVIFPAIVFGVVHMYQGAKSVFKIAVMALLFGTIYIFSESLLIVVILHFVIDMIGGFFGLKINQSQVKNIDT